ncbi:hypothetical protein [Streptomyces sp. KL116D]|uniref:hypothetical protein n=1 Tax=Streptomyces sp. KL116D TaxID=3045152 RepID=UPI003555E828
MVVTAAALTLSALPASAGAASTSDASADTRQVPALPQIKATARPGAATVQLSPGQRRKLLDQATNTAPDAARSLGLGHQEKLIPKDVIKDADGTVHTRYDRTYAGPPVIGGDLWSISTTGPTPSPTPPRRS